MQWNGLRICQLALQIKLPMSKGKRGERNERNPTQLSAKFPFEPKCDYAPARLITVIGILGMQGLVSTQSPRSQIWSKTRIPKNHNILKCAPNEHYNIIQGLSKKRTRLFAIVRYGRISARANHARKYQKYPLSQPSLKFSC